MNNSLLEKVPEISVISCTYNRAKHLDNCINSVIDQTIKDWELIIVDDGSEDNTFEIVNSYLKKYENIRYIKHQNKKPWYARNIGIQASYGKYITFIDSDDKYKPNHLESRLEYMNTHPEIDIIQGGLETEDFYVADYFKPGKKINIRECVVAGTIFGKRHVFFELKGFNNIMYFEDTDLWYRAEKMFKTQRINEPQTYVYTRAETSVTKTYLAENF